MSIHGNLPKIETEKLNIRSTEKWINLVKTANEGKTSRGNRVVIGNVGFEKADVRVRSVALKNTKLYKSELEAKKELGFFSSFRFKPLKVKTASGEERWILVNKFSLAKRFGGATNALEMERHLQKDFNRRMSMQDPFSKIPESNEKTQAVENFGKIENKFKDKVSNYEKFKKPFYNNIGLLKNYSEDKLFNYLQLFSENIDDTKKLKKLHDEIDRYGLNDVLSRPVSWLKEF